MASPRPNGETLISRTARELSKLSLAGREGDYLGPEDELIGRLSVSRPTLRQAAKIVETDRLLEVRRGAKGGMYVARPAARDAIRAMARFLRLQGGTIQHVEAVSRLVSVEAAGLAAECRDESLRRRLEAFDGAIDAQEDTAKSLIRAENELAEIVSEMSGNPWIKLVMSIAYAFGMDDHSLVLYRDPEQRSQARKLQRDVCRAILDRDAEVARVMMRRRSETMTRWLSQAG